MNTTTISPEWTDTERLALITFLSAEVMQAVKGFNREKVYRLAERIQFISMASPEFLEANREQILNG